MKKSITMVLMAVGLVACTSPSLTLMGRTSGDIGTGTVEGIYLHNTGPIEIDLRNEIYVGTWVAIRNPGAMQFGLLNVYSNTGGAVRGSAWGIGQSDSGYGTAILQSPAGNGLRCEYRYSTVTVTATGVCQHEDGEIFDFMAG